MIIHTRREMFRMCCYIARHRIAVARQPHPVSQRYIDEARRSVNMATENQRTIAALHYWIGERGPEHTR